MNEQKHLLIVAHAPSDKTRLLTEAVLKGAGDPLIDDVNIRRVTPFKATSDDVLWADGIIMGTPENFGYMSGALKDFFDRIYYPCLDKTAGLPYGLYIRAGNDGHGARTSIERIVTGLRWKAVDEPVIAAGPFSETYTEKCEALGMMMAAGLEAGIF